MIDMFNLQKRLNVLKSDFDATWQKLNIDQKLADMQALEEEVAVPEIWNNPDNARAKTTQLANLHDELDPWQLLKNSATTLLRMSFRTNSMRWRIILRNYARLYVLRENMTIMMRFCASRPALAAPKQWIGLACLNAYTCVGRSVIKLKYKS